MLEGASAHQGTERWAAARNFDVATPRQSPATRAEEERSSFRSSLCCSRAYFTRSALQSRTGPLACCLNAPSTPFAAGKRRVKERALAAEWLPEKWLDGIP